MSRTAVEAPRRPTVATVTLLRQLSSAGAHAFQHADFDIAGLSITQWLNRRAGTIPWRMDATDYAAGASRSQSVITGPIPHTPWDPALHDLLEQERRPVYEEQVRAELLAEMRSAAFVTRAVHRTKQRRWRRPGPPISGESC